MLLSTALFVSCKKEENPDTGKGEIYYLYENGELNKSNFIQLKDGKWSDDDNENGTYVVSGTSITIYVEMMGEKEEYAKGTLKDGVLTLTIMGTEITYCKEGKTPSKPSGIVDDGHSVISSSECEINNKTLTAYIISSDGNYDLRDKFKVSDGASWRAFTSADCSPVTELTMRAMTIEYGWNDVYVMVENQTTYERSTYNLRVYRAPVSSVTLLDDGTYCIDKGVDFLELIIPSKYNGKKITKIGNSAFEACKSFTNVTIPDSVIVIDKNAFKNCSGLTSVTIGKGVTKIEDSAFYNCNGIENIYIADIAVWCNIDGLGSLMGGGYNYNKKLYLNNKLITDLVIPDGVVSIGDSSFGDYSRLTSVTIPSSVTSIGRWAFRGCTGLTSVTIPGSVTSIGTGAFSGCSGLNTLSLQNGVTEIMQDAFYGCNGLTSITIPDSVTSIGSSAFEGCDKLVEVINNSSLNITKGSSDNGYVARYALNVKNGGSSDIVNRNDYLFYTDNGTNYLLGYVGNATDLELPENYNGNSYEIYEYAFYGCNGLTSITIPDSVTSIGSSAFEGCDKLVEVINNSSLNITKGSSDNGYVARYALNVKNGGSSDIVNRNDYLFYTDNGTNYLLGYVGNATDLELPENYNGNSYEIYKYAFYGCGLTSITIPNSVTSIGSSAFENCGGINIHITDMAAWCNMDGLDNLMYLGWFGVGRRLYLNNELITNLVIPDGVTTIGEYAFSGYSNLTSITIPESVTSIGKSAFYKCTGLNSVIIGNGITEIGDSAFKECTELTSVKIGNGVTSIGISAFKNCTGLTSVTIPDSVTSIEALAINSERDFRKTQQKISNNIENSLQMIA